MIDLHNDALLELPPEKLLPYLRQIKKQGVDEVWLSVWTTELNDPLAVIAAKKIILDKIKNNPKYPLCRLHIEDAWFLTMENVECLVALHPHSVGLTWNYANNLAGGAHSHQGITPLGYKIIEYLESAGIQIDTAHLNRRSFWQFARFTTRQMICTHTALNAICRHRRNLTNRQIHAIIQSGGCIGLALVPEFLTRAPISCGCYDITNHIDYFKKHFSAATMHWGCDFFGTENLPAGIKNYLDLAQLLNTQIVGYSVLKKPILAYQIGNPNAKNRLLITAGMHAREWITSLALQTWLQQHKNIPNNWCIAAIPYCNPDGTTLATRGCKHLPRRRQKFLCRINQSNDFSLWKANIRAVDLNVNFDAGWGQSQTNITTPAPANYIGRKPHSEPENRALLRFIKKFQPTISLALHSKGNIIYYSRQEDEANAATLSHITNFPAILSAKSFGGLTDYLALHHNIPSFTIELGDDKLEHPIQRKYLTSIVPQLTQIIDYFLTGE